MNTWRSVHAAVRVWKATQREADLPMRICRQIVLTIVLSAGLVCPGYGEESDIFDFFEEEAKAVQVVTGSRLPASIRWSPATVYVVTDEDLAASGAETLWDALRGVPGVDVIGTRTFYGEVGIRGLNKALNNRTLVQVDGRTVLNGPFDATFWEGIPVAFGEIERIEVVQGPASALYGANAINGVINIITKTPEQLSGGRVRYAIGERRTHLADFVYGKREGRSEYKLGGGWRETNRFEDASTRASRVGKVHASFGHELSEDTRLGMSAGAASHNTEFSLGSGGVAKTDGVTGFARLDLSHRGTRLRVFWNWARPTWKEFEGPTNPVMDNDVVDLDLEHVFSFSRQNQLVVGGSYRRGVIRSNVYFSDRVSQEVWALFFESAWRPGKHLSVVTSARLDRHPLTQWVFSPRGSLVFSPNPRHALRLSAGGSFRNPTVTEGYLKLYTYVPTPFELPLEVEVLGNEDLKPERMMMVEAAYNAEIPPLKLSAAVYHCRLRDVISVYSADPFITLGEDPRISVPTFYMNLEEETRSWGGEAGLEAVLGPSASMFSNISYRRVAGEQDYQAPVSGGPKYKLNAGIRVRTSRTGSDGFSASLWTHWVDKTSWHNASLTELTTETIEVDSYLLLNARVGFAFSGSLRGLEIALAAFNLADHEHIEILASGAKANLGQGGEVIRRRITASLSYSF